MRKVFKIGTSKILLGNLEATPKNIEEAHQNVLDGNVKFRYVIDISNLK